MHFGFLKRCFLFRKRSQKICLLVYFKVVFFSREIGAGILENLIFLGFRGTKNSKNWYPSGIGVWTNFLTPAILPSCPHPPPPPHPPSRDFIEIVLKEKIWCKRWHSTFFNERVFQTHMVSFLFFSNTYMTLQLATLRLSKTTLKLWMRLLLWKPNQTVVNLCPRNHKRNVT